MFKFAGLKLLTMETSITPVPKMNRNNIFLAKPDRDWFSKFFKNFNVKFDSAEDCSGSVFILKIEILKRTVRCKTILRITLPFKTIFNFGVSYSWLWGLRPEHKKKFMGWRPKNIKRKILGNALSYWISPINQISDSLSRRTLNVRYLSRVEAE